jgi:hypothetical protein
MTCTSIKTVFFEKKKIGKKNANVFLIVDGISSDPAIAMAITSGIPMRQSPIKEIGTEAITTIINYYQKKVNFESEKMTIVLDLDEFPIIKTYIDKRNPNVMYPDPIDPKDKFAIDVKNTYNTYDQKTHIPVILVNNDISYTALALIARPSNT